MSEGPDYIGVGAETAGCLIANRLGADPPVKMMAVVDVGLRARGLADANG